VGRVDGSIVPPRPNIYNTIIITVRLETAHFFTHGDLIMKETNILSSKQGNIKCTHKKPLHQQNPIILKKNIPPIKRQPIRRQIPNPNINLIQSGIVRITHGMEITSDRDRVAEAMFPHDRPLGDVGVGVGDLVLHQAEEVNVAQGGVLGVEVDADVPDLHGLVAAVGGHFGGREV
jgi:hypothetical protein